MAMNLKDPNARKWFESQTTCHSVLTNPLWQKGGIKFNIRLPLYYILMVPHLHQILRITHNVELASFHFWWGLSKSFWWTNQTVASWLLKKVENLFSLFLLLNFHFEMVADRWWKKILSKWLLEQFYFYTYYSSNSVKVGCPEISPNYHDFSLLQFNVVTSSLPPS